MRRLAARLCMLLAAGVLCGCTVVVGQRPAAPTAAPMPTSVAAAVYPTTAPVLTPTEAVTATSAPTATSTAAATETATVQPTPLPTEPPAAVPSTIHVVQQGDTLSDIAAAYGVTVDAIMQANALTDPSKLSIGQQLVIPSEGSAPVTSPTAAATQASAPPTAPAATAAPEATLIATPIPSTNTSVTEGTVTLNIVDFTAALTPLRPEDLGYPYDGLDLAKVGAPSPHQYRTLVLENPYLVVTVLPDLGGRIYQIQDKTSGRLLLYNNPAIVPSNWGMRGWWLAVGGIEWALPTEEHGLAEYLPWEATVDSAEGEAAVTVSFEERLTGVECRVRIALDSVHSYVKISPSLTNSGPADQKLQFWVNAMYAPGANSVPGETRLVFPTGQVIVHSTGDPGLPAAGQSMPWPVYGPRDMSLLSEWHGYFGAFAQPQAQAGFMGAQAAGSGGLLRAFPPESAIGTKFFGLGDIPYSRYSQVPSSYLELWGGWTASFWSYQTLGAGQSVQWQEYWYPLPDMEAVTIANEDAALALVGNTCSLAVTAAAEVDIEAFSSQGASLQTWHASAAPGQTWTADSLPSGMAAIEVRNRADGTVLVRYPRP
ncbi:MAG: DUF5107 domain-containing protein [Anaerolineae bacterium]